MRSAEPFASVLRRRYERRSLLRSVLVAGPLLVLGRPGRAAGRGQGLGFEALPPSAADALEVAAGYAAEVVIAWGDPLDPELGPFDPARQSAAEQERRFGFNNDFNAWFPLRPGSSERGLLFVNHEYTRRTEMFRGAERARATAEQCAIEMAAHGASVVELARDPEGRWSVVVDSGFNRRLSATTPMDLCGPAAGDAALRTAADPSGRRVLGTLNNCSGGKTPWGTALSGEENIPDYFGGARSVRDERTAEGLAAMEFEAGRSVHGWELHESRFDLAQEPNEAHRFGWIVEVDPYAPDSVPKKRTALGRFRHEGASVTLARDGRVVVYSGDDAIDQCVYKFVSARPFDPQNRAANRDLLDEGTLFAARFEPDGRGRWLPLVPEGPLADWDLARILVHTRSAARLVGATPMDRPEDVDVCPLTGRVYVACTKNGGRAAGDGGANPRAKNRAGHVLELVEERGDSGARAFVWNPFLLCGDPKDADTFWAGADPGLVSPIACPDNLAFDSRGTLWIATDGQAKVLGSNDALYAVPTAGPERGRTRRFLSMPVGAEVCGPEFTPDERTLFANVQHPGEGGGLEPPTSTWPDGPGHGPRPAVVAVRGVEGGTIGL